MEKNFVAYNSDSEVHTVKGSLFKKSVVNKFIAIFMSTTTNQV